MTLGEFMAWLEGYKASFHGGGPNVDQFVEIERRLKLVQKPGLRPLWADVVGTQPAHDGDAYGGRFLEDASGFEHDVSFVPGQKDVDA